MGNTAKQNLKYLTNVVFYLVVLGLCIWLIPKFVVFFMPFVIGWIISLIANPFVAFFEKKLKIKRKAGTVFVIILVIALVAGIIYAIAALLIKQLSGFIGEIPSLWAGVEADFTNFGDIAEKYLNIPSKWRAPLNELGNIIGEALSNFTSKVQDNSVTTVTDIVGNIANVFIGVIMALLSAYFFTTDHNELTKLYEKHMPENLKTKFDLFHQCFTLAIGGYFKAQIRIEIWIYFLVLIGLSILRVDYSFLFAFLIAVLDFLPLFGTGAILWPWTLLKILSGEYVRAVGFMVIWGLGQLVRQFIQPKIMGDSIGLPALPTLIILFIGYRFGGLGGMIIAIPVGIIIVKMYEAHWFDSFMLSVKYLIDNLNEYRKIDKGTDNKD